MANLRGSDGSLRVEFSVISSGVVRYFTGSNPPHLKSLLRRDPLLESYEESSYFNPSLVVVYKKGRNFFDLPFSLRLGNVTFELFAAGSFNAAYRPAVAARALEIEGRTCSSSTESFVYKKELRSPGCDLTWLVDKAERVVAIHNKVYPEFPAFFVEGGVLMPFFEEARAVGGAIQKPTEAEICAEMARIFKVTDGRVVMDGCVGANWIKIRTSAGQTRVICCDVADAVHIGPRLTRRPSVASANFFKNMQKKYASVYQDQYPKTPQVIEMSRLLLYLARYYPVVQDVELSARNEGLRRHLASMESRNIQPDFSLHQSVFEDLVSDQEKTSLESKFSEQMRNGLSLCLIWMVRNEKHESEELLGVWLDLAVFLKNQGKDEPKIFSALRSCSLDQLYLWAPYSDIPGLDFSYMVGAANPSLQAGRAAMMSCFLRANRSMEDVRGVAQVMEVEDFEIAERFRQESYSDKARACFASDLMLLKEDRANLNQFSRDLLSLDTPHADQLYVLFYPFISDSNDVRKLFSRLKFAFVPENELGAVQVCVESLMNENKGQEALQRFLSSVRGDYLLAEYERLLSEVVTWPADEAQEAPENYQDDAPLSLTFRP